MAGAGPFGGAGLCAIFARMEAAFARSTACDDGFDSSFDAGRCACDALLARSMAAWEGWALCFVGTINPTPLSSESDRDESESDDKFSTGRARFLGGGFLGGAGFLDLLCDLEGTTKALAVVSSSAGKSSPRSSDRRLAPI